MDDRDRGEPISGGRRDRAHCRQGVTDALIVVGSFGVAAIVTGLLAMLLIELLRAAGLWN